MMVETQGLTTTVEERKDESEGLQTSETESVLFESSRRSWRMAFVDLQILSLLHSRRMTGYSIRKNLNSRFGILISFGTLYPRLKFLERIQVLKAIVESRPPSSSTVVTYELTPKGVMDLRTGLVSYENSIRTMVEILNMPAA